MLGNCSVFAPFWCRGSSCAPVGGGRPGEPHARTHAGAERSQCSNGGRGGRRGRVAKTQAAGGGWRARRGEIRRRLNDSRSNTFPLCGGGSPMLRDRGIAALRNRARRVRSAAETRIFTGCRDTRGDPGPRCGRPSLRCARGLGEARSAWDELAARNTAPHCATPRNIVERAGAERSQRGRGETPRSAGRCGEVGRWVGDAIPLGAPVRRTRRRGCRRLRRGRWHAGGGRPCCRGPPGRSASWGTRA